MESNHWPNYSCLLRQVIGLEPMTFMTQIFHLSVILTMVKRDQQSFGMDLQILLWTSDFSTCSEVETNGQSADGILVIVTSPNSGEFLKSLRLRFAIQQKPKSMDKVHTWFQQSALNGLICLSARQELCHSPSNSWRTHKQTMLFFSKQASSYLSVTYCLSKLVLEQELLHMLILLFLVSFTMLSATSTTKLGKYMWDKEFSKIKRQAEYSSQDG